MSSRPTSSSLGHEERLWLWQKKKCELVGMFDTVEVKISIFKVGTDNLKLSSCRYRSTQRQPDRFLFASELRRPTTREKNVGLLTRLVSNGAILPSFSISCLVAKQNDTVSVKFMNLKADDVFILSPSVVSSQFCWIIILPSSWLVLQLLLQQVVFFNPSNDLLTRWTLTVFYVPGNNHQSGREWECWHERMSVMTVICFGLSLLGSISLTEGCRSQVQRCGADPKISQHEIMFCKETK